MSIQAIAFRIHEDSRYQGRWSSVNDAIKKETSSTYSAELTSFFEEFSAAAIEGNSSLASYRDLLLVTDLTDRGYGVIGKVIDGDLRFLDEAS